MAAISRTRVSLGMFGDDLDPAYVTARLGVDPTRSYHLGDIRTGSAGRTYRMTTGSWHFEAGEREPGDMDAQITNILSALTDDLSAWRDLVARYRGRLICGLFLDETNQMAGIDASTLRQIADRGLELVLDIYGLDGSSTPEVNDASL